MKIINRHSFTHSFAVVATCAPLVANAMPILQVKEGILAGAKNVEVNGQKYDVTFTGGSCTDAFGTCALSSFYFGDFDTAQAASQALINQVFVDGAVGTFDRDSSLTSGCQAYTSYCYVFTPVAMDGGIVIGGTAMNYSGRSRSETARVVYRSVDAASVNLTYARWTAASAEVPEPGSVALLAIAFAGMRVSLRRRRPT